MTLHEQRINILKKEVIRPEIELFSQSVDLRILLSRQELKNEFIEQYKKLEAQMRDNMTMVEEVLNQVEGLEKRTLQNKAQ